MKLIQKLITLPAAVLIFVFLTVSAFAAGTAPEIQLSETGAANQYKITIKNWDSSAYSVQFDLSIDSAETEFRMDWADSSASSFKKVEQETSGGKTNLEFYWDRLSPISNSDSAVIGNVTFASPSQKLSFSSAASVKLVDGSYREKNFESVSVKTVAWTPSDEGSSEDSGNQGSGDPDSGNSSNQNSPSSSSGSSSKRNSSSSKDSKSAKAAGEPASYRVKKSASPAVSWDAIAKNIKVQDGKSVLSVDMTEDGRISTEILKQLKKKKVLVTFNYGKYRWVIDGSAIGEIPDNQEYYDLTVSLLTMTNLSTATDRTDLVQFEVAYDGKLPFTATLYYPVGKEHAGKTVTLSYYDEQKGTLDFRASATAEEDGMVAFSFDHFSKYVMTSEDLWHEEAPETATTTANGASATAQTASVLVPPAGDAVTAEAAATEDGDSDLLNPPQTDEQDGQDSETEPAQEEEQAPVSLGTVENPSTVSPTLLIVLISAAAIVILLVLSVVKKKSSSQGGKRG